jgi:DNA-binding MarR family transcriptional regulator
MDGSVRRGTGLEPSLPLIDGVDASAVSVMHEFMLLGRIHRQLMHQVFTRQDLHPAQAMCIGVLSLRGELTQSELAEALILSRPSVTRLLQRMERGGLVRRRPGEDDQRQTLVSLTPAGLQLQHRMHAATTEYTVATLAQLPPEDRAELARILPAWRRLLEAAPCSARQS